jgi:hypothetical protein
MVIKLLYYGKYISNNTILKVEYWNISWKRRNLWSILDHMQTEEENISDILFVFSLSC